MGNFIPFITFENITQSLQQIYTNLSLRKENSALSSLSQWELQWFSVAHTTRSQATHVAHMAHRSTS